MKPTHDTRPLLEELASHQLQEPFFQYFYEITRIPRGSGSTKEISDYCAAFAKQHGLRAVQDDMNNVVIYKGGTAGRENLPPVILQGHLDMVCAREPDAPVDPETDGVIAHTDGEWIWAEGTSLGADNGIAVAYCLAILAADTLEHPPLEVLFTADEETGMYGAQAIDPQLFQGARLINLDSEEEGVFIAGCAGGQRVNLSIPAPRVPVTGAVCQLSVSGLLGGHSGVMIHTGRANACKLLLEGLRRLSERWDISLLQLDGGEKDNAIPRSALAWFIAAPEDAGAIQGAVAAFSAEIAQRYGQREPQLRIAVEVGPETCAEGIPAERSRAIVETLDRLPNGVQRWLPDLPQLPETSLNMGVVKTREDILVCCLLRSSAPGACAALAEEIQRLTAAVGASCESSGIYPPWPFQGGAELHSRCLEAYRAISGREGKLDVIHAGLECGILCEKLPGLEAVSFGPTMSGVHTTQERLSVGSAQAVFKLLESILSGMRS